MTAKQLRFCSEFVKSGDMVEAYENAGYTLHERPEVTRMYAARLLGTEKIKRQIAKEMRHRLLAANLGESQFVLFPVKRLMENLECTIEVLVERIKNEVKSESIESFLSLCEIQKETVEMVGTWLGYDDHDTAE
jgi:phage terminase small subunit